MSANYVLIGEITTSVATASVTLSNIPQTGYTDIKIVTSTRLNNTDSPILVNFNGVTTGYSWRRIYGNGTSASSLSGSDAYFLHGNTSSTTANTFSNSEFYIPNYTVSQSKSISVETALETNGASGELFMLAALWANNASITTISMTPLTGSFVAGSTFSLYGIAALNVTPTVLPKASGGDIVVNDGTYWYHAFLSSGVFAPSSNLSCDTLVIAGGGGGGLNLGGGGGAGGLRYATQSLVATNYSVTVGAGGAGGILGGGSAVNGSNSIIGSITSTGGGAGGDSADTNATASSGKAGGSGGGATGYYTDTTYPGGAASPSGQGNAGGSATGNKTPPFGNGASGGGGGAGAAGSNSATSAPFFGGNGGNGLSTYSSWGSATNTGENVSGTYWYAGGGAGSGASGTTRALGGNGGGGDGGIDGGVDSTDGSVNTGGGGGGSRGNNTNGKAGGSGIVIVRYTMA